MHAVTGIIRLVAISCGMAIAISCNNVLASLFSYTQGLNLIFALAVAAVFMLVIAFCFIELSSKFPGAIGIRAFTKAAFGESLSIAATLFYVGLVVLMGAFEVFLCFRVLNTFISGWAAVVAMCVLLGGIVIVNLRGHEISLSLQIIMTVAVITMLAALAVGTSGAAGADAHALDTGLIQAVPIALFLFVGVEWACLYVARFDDYRFRVPAAMATAILVIFLVYSALAISLGAQFPGDEIPSLALPHVALARSWDSESGWIAVSLISLLALLTSFNVGLSGASRILYSLSREGALPRWLAYIHIPTLVPRKAVLTVATAVAGLSPLLFSDSVRASFPQLLGIDLCIVYGATLAAWLRLRRQNDARGLRKNIPIPVVWIALGLLAMVTGGSVIEGFSPVLIGVLVIQLLFVRFMAGKREKQAAVA